MEQRTAKELAEDAIKCAQAASEARLNTIDQATVKQAEKEIMRAEIDRILDRESHVRRALLDAREAARYGKAIDDDAVTAALTYEPAQTARRDPCSDQRQFLQPRGDVMITRWSEVVCDQCSTGCHCMPTAAESRRCAKEEGWIRRKGRDLCPECKGEESQ